MDERAEGEGAVLFIKGELEDAQVTDADHLHLLIVSDAPFTVDINHETCRFLIHIHAIREKDWEGGFCGFAIRLGLLSLLGDPIPVFQLHSPDFPPFYLSLHSRIFVRCLVQMLLLSKLNLCVALIG